MKPGLGYVVALVGTGLAAALALALRPVLHPGTAPLFLIVVAASAVAGGLGPGLLATLLSAIAVNYWFYEPISGFGFATTADLVRQLVFWIVGALLAALIARSRLGRLERAARAEEAGAEAARADEARLRAEARAARAEAAANEAAQPIASADGTSAAWRNDLSLAAYADQQAALAGLAFRAQRGTSLQAVLDDAAVTVAATLDVQLCEILELLPSGDTLLLRAGVGWEEGAVGHATVPGGGGSQPGYALASRLPVVTSDVTGESRFEVAVRLSERGAASGVSLAIPAAGRLFGVLSAYSTALRTFRENEIGFLQGVADLLGARIGREATDGALRTSLTEPFSTLAPDWRFTFVNSKAAELAGRPAHELLGRIIWETMPALLGTDYERQLRRAMNERTPVHAEFWTPTIGWLESRVHPYHDGVAIHSSRADVLRLALAAFGAGEWTWDLSADRLLLSRDAAELHGLPGHRPIALTELLDAIHPADRTRVREAADRSLSEGVEYAADYRVASPTGGTRWIAARGRAASRNGSPERWIGVALDVTEWQRAEWGPAPGQTTAGRLAREAGPAPGVETVLVVEGDPQVRQLACRALGRSGLRWLSACDGEEALELLDRYQFRIDLVVTDVVTPETSGEELAERLLARRPGLRVLFTSELTRHDAIRRGWLAADRPFLQKPFTSEALLESVREVLGGPTAGS